MNYRYPLGHSNTSACVSSSGNHFINAVRADSCLLPPLTSAHLLAPDYMVPCESQLYNTTLLLEDPWETVRHFISLCLLTAIKHSKVRVNMFHSIVNKFTPFSNLNSHSFPSRCIYVSEDLHSETNETTQQPLKSSVI